MFSIADLSMDKQKIMRIIRTIRFKRCPDEWTSHGILYAKYIQILAFTLSY